MAKAPIVNEGFWAEGSDDDDDEPLPVMKMSGGSHDKKKKEKAYKFEYPDPSANSSTNPEPDAPGGVFADDEVGNSSFEPGAVEPESNAAPKDCSFAKDKSVVKIVLKDGSGWELPKDATKVVLRVQWVRQGMQDFLKEPKVVEFTVGNGDVCDALEMVAVHMYAKEESGVAVTQPQIFEEPLLGLVFPEWETPVDFVVEMVSFERGQDPYLMDENEKITHAEARKAVGGELFKKNRVALALERYTLVTCLFSYTDEYDVTLPANEKKIEELKRACQLNKAMCQLKLSRFDDARYSCHEVLAKDRTNIKAQYRLASAELGLKNHDDAIAVLKRLLESDPKNGDARRLLKQAQEERKEANKKSKGLFAKMGGDIGKGPIREPEENESLGYFGAQYRFKVGTRVECQAGGGWAPGEIVKLNYSEPDWPPGKIVPYQVQLDDGRLIYVPSDVPQLCRFLAPPWWVDFFSPPASRDAKLPSPDGLRKACKDQDVNATDSNGLTALHQAVCFNWQSGVVELLKMAADVNIADKEKVHPLHLAVQHGRELMNILLEADADPNCRDSNPNYDPNFTSVTFGDRPEHRTPLHYCCAEGLEDPLAMILLIQAKADLDAQDGEGKAPLHVAIDENHDDVVDVLLQSKADVNLGSGLSNIGNSPLMDAAHENKTDLASRLILGKADVHKQGKQGMSALHLAARRGNTKMVQILMEGRADTSQKSNLGTPLDLAKKNGGLELLELFGVEANPGTGSTATSIAELDAAQRKALFLD